jgi:hypothetical protein
MTQDDFAIWLTRISNEADGRFDPDTLRPSWRTWLQDVFREWGPLSAEELGEVALMDESRLQEAAMADARRLVPAVLADGAAVGMELDVQISPGSISGVHVRVRYEPGGRYRWASNGDIQLRPGSDADLLRDLADEIQEVSMERDQINVFVWPVCPRHQIGGHATVSGGQAVWRCSGDGGHVIAAIGHLRAG